MRTLPPFRPMMSLTLTIRRTAFPWPGMLTRRCSGASRMLHSLWPHFRPAARTGARSICCVPRPPLPRSDLHDLRFLVLHVLVSLMDRRLSPRRRPSSGAPCALSGSRVSTLRATRLQRLDQIAMLRAPSAVQNYNGIARGTGLPGFIDIVANAIGRPVVPGLGFGRCRMRLLGR